MPQLPVAFEILGAMITPAVLISASGTLALSTSNRLARVVDRVRVLARETEAMPDGLATRPEDVERRTLVVDEIADLGVRIRLLWSSLSALYAAIGFLVGTSLSVGLTASADPSLGWVSVGLALLGGAALFVASVMLLQETRVAVKASLREMDSVREAVARKAGRPFV